MITSRRRFLFGITAVAASVAPALVAAENIMRIKPQILTLYGDGIHDDAPVMSRFLCGEKVWCAASGSYIQGRDNTFKIPKATYRLGSTIKFNNDGSINDLGGSTFVFTHTKVGFDVHPTIAKLGNAHLIAEKDMQALIKHRSRILS